MNSPELYLASSSPRRSELLTQLNVRFEVVSQNVAEQYREGENPETYVKRLALEKAQAGLESLSADNIIPVLGADTAVVIDEHILGKPADKAAAIEMLKCLSGRSHQVLSAVAVVARDNLGQDRSRVRRCVRLNQNQVTFRVITDRECEAYWASGEPSDKAGGYGIQGLAAIFIERLEGSYSGVMGLPLFETNELLVEFGIQVIKNKCRGFD